MIVDESRPFFVDRVDAGKRLAAELAYYAGKAVVFAIPHGGVPVAVQVARALRAPLDVMVARKIQIPFNPEAGYGAVAEDGSIFLNQSLVGQLRLGEKEISEQAEQVRSEIARRAALYRARLAPVSAQGKVAILIDDGLASGYTMVAAVKSAASRGVARTVVAVPVASADALEIVRTVADEIVPLVIARTRMFAVADFYSHWYDLSDNMVLDYLEDWEKENAAPTGSTS